MIYSDFIEYNLVGDIKTPLLRCIPFISKVKSEDIISTEQYMNYQFFTNLQFKKLIKNSLHSFKIEPRYTTGEKTPLCPKEIHELFSFFARFRIITFDLYFTRNS